MKQNRRIPYGYCILDAGIGISETEASVVRQIFTMYNKDLLRFWIKIINPFKKSILIRMSADTLEFNNFRLNFDSLAKKLNLCNSIK